MSGTYRVWDRSAHGNVDVDHVAEQIAGIIADESGAWDYTVHAGLPERIAEGTVEGPVDEDYDDDYGWVYAYYVTVAEEVDA